MAAISPQGWDYALPPFFFLGRIRTIHLFRIMLKPFVTPPNSMLKLGRSEVTVAAVHRLAPGAIQGQKFLAKKVKLPPEFNEFTENLPEGRPAGAAEVGDGPEVRTQTAQQPDHLKSNGMLRFPTDGLSGPVSGIH